jgi:putative hydrolase of the HAD superfamily
MNVVFDLGGVVVAWKPDEIVARAFADPDDRRLARREIIGHPDWLALDRGTLSYDDAVVRGAKRTGLSEAAVRALIDSVPASLVADAEAVALLHRVKAGGHDLYCLSNMPAASIEHLERVYSFWHLFTGVVVSSRVRLCKPEPEIYACLIDAYRLRAPDTVFIDDTVVNLNAAAGFGLRTIHFQSVQQCEAELRDLERDRQRANLTKSEANKERG